MNRPVSFPSPTRPVPDLLPQRPARRLHTDADALAAAKELAANFAKGASRDLPWDEMTAYSVVGDYWLNGNAPPRTGTL